MKAIIKTAHCFFEQSGTFKNEFKKLGINAYDYDIRNDFKETDYKINLFLEINKAYDNKKSIFNKIESDDIILAFFPCIRFEIQSELLFRGTASSMKKWSDEKKLEYDLKLHKELSELYALITKLVILCLKRKIKLIIENPYSATHYLKKYWAIQPKIIDNDRTRRGDFFIKPTQYFFINCEPKTNFILEPITYNKQKKVCECNQIEKSLISKDYARRFIKEFLL